ncbi:MAG TPA: tetratricopeptide repeat protein, partial [Ardenticatenaceae bacterium]|nr:tetratricopeptide repeat protein [Ardenticatenaceae bacterium]
LMREMGDRQGAARALNNLGRLAHLQGDYAAAQALYEESLALRREMGDKRGVAESLSGLAAVAGVGHGKAELAARLAAAAHSLLELMGSKLDRTEQAVYDQGVAAARRELDEDAFAAAWNEGQAMTLDEAVAYALERGI